MLIYPLAPKEYGLDLDTPVVGIALSFPDTADPAGGVEYHVNNTYWQQEFELA